MASCRCGADILWVRRVDTGEKFPIDATASSPRGPGRFRPVEYGATWQVEPVSEEAAVSAYTDHRLNCPGVSAPERTRLLLALRGDEDAAAHGGTGARQ